MQLFVKIRNATLLLPVSPDPCTAGAATSAAATGTATPDTQSAAVALEALYGAIGAGNSSVSSGPDTSSVCGNRHFPGAVPHSMCPATAAGFHTSLRVAELDIDMRSVPPDFNLVISASPINIVVSRSSASPL